MAAGEAGGQSRGVVGDDYIRGLQEVGEFGSWQMLYVAAGVDD
jgi:hypothetical protein